jgi:hypothetical protein
MARATTEIIEGAVGDSDTDADGAVVTPRVEGPLRAPRRRRPRRERSQLTGITISATLLAAGVFAALHASNAAEISVATALAACLIVVGGGLVVGAVYGRGRGLIALGVLLTAATAVATVADVPLAGGTGKRFWNPPFTSAVIERHYELGAGEGVLDLRHVDLSGATRRVEVTVGVGHLEVDLPPDAEVIVDAHVGFGEVVLAGTDQGGVDVDRHVVLDGNNGRLELDLRVGMGRLDVYR